MPDTTNNESNQSTDALDGLPQKEREETQQIIDEIEKGKAPEGEKPADLKPEDKKEDKPAEKKPDAPNKPEGDKPNDEKGKPQARRDANLIPAFVHHTAKNQWEKREKELLADIEKLKGTSSKENKPEEKSQELPKDLEAKAKEFAEKHDITVELATDLLKTQFENNKIPEEITKKLGAFDDFKRQEEIKAEVKQFNADFTSIVEPLIKAEYGNDISPEIIEKIKDELKVKAYSPEFAKVPYSVLYKGDDSFRGVVPPKKKGAEGSRGGHTATVENNSSGADDLDLTKPLSDEVLNKLTNAQFDEYEKNMIVYEKSQKK